MPGPADFRILASVSAPSPASPGPFDRAAIVVFDSAGCGDAPDAAEFGDLGANTLGHIHERVGLKVPNLARLGWRRILPLGDGEVVGAWGRMRERSRGKDTTTGHWEIAGALLEQPFPTYPDGFPPEVILPFERVCGKPVLWNRVASGTEILDRLGDEHVRTGRPIVYTSADSVFQVATHEDVVPLETLHAWCRAAREILRGPHEVGRVIARPFVGRDGRYERTANRRDFSVLPPDGCLPQVLADAGLAVVAVGKIEDIFAGRGITEAVHTKDNAEGARLTADYLRRGPRRGLIFTNLVDFDTKHGHRNDVEGYARCLEEADRQIVPVLEALGERDLLVITADHGNDPTDPSTDHSRELVPLVAYHRRIRPVDLGLRPTFADLGQTVAANFGLRVANGESFLGEVS